LTQKQAAAAVAKRWRSADIWAGRAAAATKPRVAVRRAAAEVEALAAAARARTGVRSMAAGLGEGVERMEMVMMNGTKIQVRASERARQAGCGFQVHELRCCCCGAVWMVQLL